MRILTPCIAALVMSISIHAQVVDMDGIYLSVAYRSGTGGAVYPTYQPHIFLRDGSVTTDLSYVPGSTADVAAWRQRKPNAWGRWTKSAGAIQIQWDDPSRKPATWKKWFIARPGTPGLALDGTYRSTGGGGNTALGGDVMTVAWNSYEFRGGMVTVNGGAGVSTSGSGTGVSVAGSSRRDAQTGRYKIDGYTIQIDLGDGPPRREWFYLYPDSDRVIGVGNRTFSLKR